MTVMLVLAAGLGGAGAFLLPDLRLALGPLVAGMLLAYFVLGRAPLIAGRTTLVSVLLLGALLRLPLLNAWPTTSDDLYRYLFEGRVVAAAESPYRFAPESGRLAALRDDFVFPQVNNRAIATIYLPLAEGAFWLATRFGDGPLPFKLLLLLTELVAAGALGVARLRQRRSLGPVALYLFNPLLIVESGDGGHLDSLGAALVLIALTFTVTHRETVFTPLLLIVAALTKPLPLLFLPLFARSRRALFTIGAGVIVALTGTAWLLSSLPEGSLESDGAFHRVLNDGSTSPCSTLTAKGLPDLRVAVVDGEFVGDGPVAADGRSALIRERNGTVRALVANPSLVPMSATLTQDATDLIGTYQIAGFDESSAGFVLSVSFDAKENCRLRALTEADALAANDVVPQVTSLAGLFGGGLRLRYYADQGRFVVFHPTTEQTWLTFALAADRRTLFGEFRLEGQQRRPAFGIKGAESPLMGFSQFQGRWSGTAAVFPWLERLTGSRQKATRGSALCLVLLLALLFWLRVEAAVAVLVLSGMAVLLLPVIYPWYFAWPLAAAVLVKRPLLPATLIAFAPFLHSL